MEQKKYKIIALILALAFCLSLQAQTPLSTTFSGTPASCVITSPFSNAYFQVGSVIPIKIYSTDFGGSSAAGNVVRVEVFNGNTFLGSLTTHTNHTYTYNWNCVQAGTYILKARAIDNSGNVSGSAGVKVVVGTNPVSPRGLSANKGKYLGNIIAGSVPQNYNTYWNGVTAENDCKWGTVERNRNQMNWTGADRSFNHAKNNHMIFRYHALAWGNQHPCWAISGQGCSGTNNSGTPTLQITASAFQEEMEEYMAQVAARYGDDIDQLDVLNENLQFGDGGEHAPATGVFRQALGGNGASGYDWVIWLFTKARQHFPNSKLILNDYGLENDQSAINRQLAVIRVLRDRNLIDGFGTQAHEFNVNNLSANQLESALNLMDNSGVPTYVTELDISGTDDQQNTRYQALLPVYWNHPSVAGITLWGYIEGQTWISNTGLVSSGNNGATESPAMVSIKNYINGRTNVGYPFGNIASPSNCVNNALPTVTLSSPTNGQQYDIGANVTLNATATDTDGSIVSVSFYNGGTLLFTDNSAPYAYTWNNVQEGQYTITAVALDNDGGSTTSDDVVIIVGNPILNLLENGEFNNGTTGWSLQLNNSTTGTMTVVTNANMSGNNALRICPTSAGDATWNVQVRYELPIENGKNYEISYLAKADAARTISTVVQQDVDPYTIHFIEDVNLTTTSQRFTHIYNSDVTDTDAKLKFFMGTNTTCWTLDDVVVREIIVTATPDKLEPTTIFPNPFDQSFHINSKGEFDYSIYSMTGVLLENGKATQYTKLGDNLNSGVYSLTIKQENQISTSRIIKN